MTSIEFHPNEIILLFHFLFIELFSRISLIKSSFIIDSMKIDVFSFFQRLDFFPESIVISLSSLRSSGFDFKYEYLLFVVLFKLEKFDRMIFLSLFSFFCEKSFRGKGFSRLRMIE